MALREASLAVQQQSGLLKEAILDSKQELWCVLPTHSDPSDPKHLERTKPSEKTWPLLASRLTDIWMDTDPNNKQPKNNHHGILVCGIEELLTEIERFNQIKAQLITASSEVRGGVYEERVKGDNPNVTQAYLNDLAIARSEYLSKSRDSEFHQILRGLGIPSMNFAKARKMVRVLEENTTLISYTWNKNHYRKRQIPLEAIAALSAHLDKSGHENRANQIREGIGQNDGSTLYKVSFSKPTLRVNYKYKDDKGEVHRSSCLASGVIVVQQNDIPVVNWKLEPTEEEIQEAKAKWLDKDNLKRFELAPHMELYKNVK